MTEVQEEKEHIMIGSARKLSVEQEKVRDLEEKLAESNRKTAKFSIENSNLYKVLETKDKFIEELSQLKLQSEEKWSDESRRLESLQKQNVSLNYEVSMIQKELEIRNQEREYNLKSADASNEQQAENLRKIAALEVECKKLRVMVRMRLPGPTAIAKMRSEFELVASTPVETRKQKLNSASAVSPRGFASDKHNAKLHAIEDENNILKQSLVKKNSELQFMQMKYADEANKLSLVKKQLEELSNSKAKATFDAGESRTSNSKDIGNTDTNSCSASWASALISELEHFNRGKRATSSRESIGLSEMSLIYDMMELEKLGMVSVDQIPNPSTSLSAWKETSPITDLTEANGEELIGVDGLSEFHETLPGWLQDILKLIIEKHQITQKSVDVILEEVKIAFNGRDSNDNIRKSVADLIEQAKVFIHTSPEKEENTVLPEKSASHFSGTAEFTDRLQDFVRVCGDLIDQKADLEKFTHAVCSMLDWILKRCFSPQCGSNTDKSFLETSTIDEEKDLESVIDATSLDAEIKVNYSEGSNGAEVVNLGGVDGDIGAQFTASEIEPNKAYAELSSIEPVPEKNSSCSDGKEPDCPELMQETERFCVDGNSGGIGVEEQKQFRTNMEISAAAEKLSECQETIINLSKRLKALATPQDAVLLDESTIDPVMTRKCNHRPRSLCQVLAEDDAKSDEPKSSISEQVESNDQSDVMPEKIINSQCSNDDDAIYNNDANNSAQKADHPTLSESHKAVLAVVPAAYKQKRGVSLLRKLVFGSKRESTKKLALPMVS